MSATATIFFQIDVPHAATLFYFSGLLAVALFVKFSRLLSMRNWDVLTLFLLVPGLLLLDDGPETKYWGYLALLGVSGYFLVRCLVDLTLVRRPALAPNLSLGGLIWLACTLFVGLIAVAVQAEQKPPESGETAAGLDAARRQGEKILRQTAAGVDDATVELWAERGFTVACHLVIVIGLALVGWRHFDDLHAGVAAATFYLLLPYAFLLLPRSSLGVGRWHDAWPMALMIWMVLAYRRPRLAGLFLGLAAGSAFFPFLLLPVWLSFYWKRGMGRFALSFVLSAGLCLAVLGGILWFNGELPEALRTGWTSTAWQPWKQPSRDTHGLWRDIPTQWAYRLPIFLAYVALLGVTSFWPSPKNLAHVLALSAALLLGIQFWYADQGGVYVLWYLPFLLLLVFRPNLTSCQPSPPEDDWVARLGRTLIRRLRLALRWTPRPQPVRVA
jgi:hypothetical protein